VLNNTNLINNKLKDFAINITASVLLIGMTQLVVYPLLGRWLSTAEYGTMLTLIGIMNAVGSSFGGALNNAKILLASQYDKEHLSGDSNIFAVFSSIACFIFAFCLSSIIQHKIEPNNALIGIVSMLVFFRAFYSAAFRIKINYKRVLISNLFGVLGYAVGILLVYYSSCWILAFLCGELFPCIYVSNKSFILREPFKTTSLLKQLSTRFGFYFVSNGLTYIITYMDRFFLFPILGSTAVSTYTTASLLGKMAGIALTPITGVLLSYYCKEGNITKKQLGRRLLVFSFISLLVYSIIVAFGYPILVLLYPTLAPLAKPYFYVANLGSIILLLGDSILPTVLRYAKPQWAAIVQATFAIFYILIGIGGMMWNGLFGYCIAVLAVNILRLLMLVAVSFYSIAKGNMTEMGCTEID